MWAVRVVELAERVESAEWAVWRRAPAELPDWVRRVEQVERAEWVEQVEWWVVGQAVGQVQQTSD